jgi:predicted nucleic acid-binding Zn ribbon protein
MPVYLYRNLNTGETFEVEQRITESALAVHPTTGDPVKRLIQPVGIAFKGSGFYVTDSRNGSSRRPSTGGDAAKETSTSTSGGDSAPPPAATSTAVSSSTSSSTTASAASD